MPVTEIVEGNHLNQAGGRVIRNKSKFVNKYPICGTYRFGEYGPCYVAETVPNDHFIVHVGHNVISANLSAPLLQDVMLKKDFFWVPDMAILPMNWEKFFVNPVKGDDVPIDVGCCVEGFTKKIGTFFDAWQSYIYTLDYQDADEVKLMVEHSIKFLLCAEQFYSEGCLLASLQCNLSPLFAYGVNAKPFSELFDDCIDLLMNAGTTSITLPDGSIVTISGKNLTQTRSIIEQLRDDYNWSVSTVDAQFAQDIVALIVSCQIDKLSEIDVNLRRLFAYQIACAHFYTNDKIDYVYSAELYRQLIYNTFLDFANLSGIYKILTFTVNGLSYQYDYCSAGYFDKFLEEVIDDGLDNLAIGGDSVSFLDYLRLIFGFNYSLRYADYFTGARSQPLAVGDVNVAVNNSMVNVVNVAAKTMAAKMLNVANRVGQRVEAYVKEFFGIEMAKDYHNPFWLMHTTDSIGNPETQNTGAAQQSGANTITSIFRQQSGSEGFEMNADRAGIIIGIQYFDIQRVYPHGINKLFLHKDRFDDFLPYLQYIGDQSIQTVELDTETVRDPDQVFGYTGRNMEYKQNVPYCFGGFYRDLKPYIFLADEQRFKNGFMSWHIGPSYIRSLPSELDRFFNVLNGASLDTYYHFAIVNNVYCEAIRPMAALPGILNG